MELPRQDQFLRNCQTTMHWGNKMNGPNCDKLLHHAKQLTDFLPHDLKKFGIALERFQDFKMACFTQDLKPDWPERLELLKEAFDKLGVRMTPKIHCLFQHVPEFLTRHPDHGLGFYSEQPFEAVHSAFNKTWPNYKRNMDSPDYPEKFKAAVVAFNSSNIG